jgi:SAM-dependent methyltransferase
MNQEVRPSLGTLSLMQAYSYVHYQQLSSQLKKLGEYERRRQIEDSLLTGAMEFSVPGYCYVTSRYTEFAVTLSGVKKPGQPERPNWRETLLSDGVYNNRMRASMHLFEEVLRPRKDDPIYVTEQCAPLYGWLKQRYTNTIGSEYLGAGITPGSVDEHGVRNESLIALSFPNESMQFVLSFDCFEHFSDYKSGLRECFRVLKDGGSLFITVPFRRDSTQNIVRARDREDGCVEHLLPPEYHGDPLRKEGCLCYYHFGWELLDDMWVAGFRDPRACFYWSREFGYLGIEQVLFYAVKPMRSSFSVT